MKHTRQHHDLVQVEIIKNCIGRRGRPLKPGDTPFFHALAAKAYVGRGEAVFYTPPEPETKQDARPEPAPPPPIPPVETEGALLQCPVCDREFGTARGRTQHMNRMHPDEHEND
jgi:hypothetical protein